MFLFALFSNKTESGVLLKVFMCIYSNWSVIYLHWKKDLCPLQAMWRTRNLPRVYPTSPSKCAGMGSRWMGEWMLEVSHKKVYLYNLKQNLDLCLNSNINFFEHYNAALMKCWSNVTGKGNKANFASLVLAFFLVWKSIRFLITFLWLICFIIFTKRQDICLTTPNISDS